MILDEATLQMAVFELLVSSTARRYMREARRIADTSGLTSALRGNPPQAAEARARAFVLLAQVAAGRERSPAEFELALLLCALAHVDAKDTLALLQVAAESKSPWIRSLAQRLWALGPASPEALIDLHEQIAVALEDPVPVAGPLDERDREDPNLFPRAA
jgi:hypothetical protein